jgi:hypothetical protein
MTLGKKGAKVTIKLVHAGELRVKVAKEIRNFYDGRLSLSAVKRLVMRTPSDLPEANNTECLINTLRSLGATVVVNPGPLEIIAIVGCIKDAEKALCDGDIDKVRKELRAALNLCSG